MNCTTYLLNFRPQDLLLSKEDPIKNRNMILKLRQIDLNG